MNPIIVAGSGTPSLADSVAERLGVHQRGARDFFDALVALELLDRDRQGRYANRPDCVPYLDRRSPSYLGGGLDLSISAVMALSGTVCAELLLRGFPWPLVLAAGLASGAAVGLAPPNAIESAHCN